MSIISVFYAWDKEGQPSIVELAKDTTNKKLPANFPIDKFLALYKEWEAAKKNFDPNEGHRSRDSGHIFALLRDMHQEAGINKNPNFINLDPESDMRLFAEYVQKVKSARASTAVAVAAAAPAVPAPVPAAVPAAPAPTPAAAVATAAPAVPAPAPAAVPAAPAPAPAASPEAERIAAVKRVTEALKSVKAPDGYTLTLEEKTNRVWLTGPAGRRYYTVGNPENKDKEDAK
jgi:hypothetical protein